MVRVTEKNERFGIGIVEQGDGKICLVPWLFQDYRVRFLLILLFGILFLSGCAVTEKAGRTVEFDLAGKTAVYMESGVVREAPVIHVQPVNATGGLKVLFIPFRMTQRIDDPEMAGYSLAKTFWQTWSSMRIFDQFEFAAESHPFRRDLALALARSKGADLVFGGFITYMLAGGGTGASRIGLQIEGYDVSSGLLVWSLAQSGAIPAPRTRDYLILEVKNKLPVDPLYAITQSLAADMGEVMREWLSHAENLPAAQ